MAYKDQKSLLQLYIVTFIVFPIIRPGISSITARTKLVYCSNYNLTLINVRVLQYLYCFFYVIFIRDWKMNDLAASNNNTLIPLAKFLYKLVRRFIHYVLDFFIINSLLKSYCHRFSTFRKDYH